MSRMPCVVLISCALLTLQWMPNTDVFSVVYLPVNAVPIDFLPISPILYRPRGLRLFGEVSGLFPRGSTSNDRLTNHSRQRWTPH